MQEYKKQQLNALVSREDFNQMFLEIESKWLENHEMINYIKENLCNLNKCIAVPDHSFQKKDETMHSKRSNFSNLDKHIVVVENHEGNFSEDSWATVVRSKVSSKLKSVPLHKTDQTAQKVFIGMNSHKVTDHFHVIQCFKCQGFGHKAGSTFCPLVTSENSVCLYCAGGHISKTSPYKNNADEYKFSNCLKSRIKDYHKHAKGHTSSDMQCPLKTKEIKRIMALTNVDPKN